MDILINKLVRKHKTNNPFLIADRMNINVWYLDMPESVRGFYLRTLKRRYIAINMNLSYEWQRFVCAHELGHDRLHKGIGRYFIDEHTLFTPGKYERQANQFAIKLLVFDEERYEDETNEQFYQRHGVPLGMIKYIHT